MDVGGMALLNLNFLGGFEIRAGTGAPVRIPAKKSKALFAYLALSSGQSHPRDKLAALLWEERGDTQARHSLRQALTNLRRALPMGGEALCVGADTLTFASDCAECDVSTFDRLARLATPQALEQAVELYRGELLEGLSAHSTAFDDWLMVQRTHLHERALGVMSALLDHYLEAHIEDRAVPLAIRLLALDPLREATHRTLMRLYTNQGRYGAALKQYRVCRAVLQHELGVAPEAKTDQLYREIYAQRRHTVRSTPTADDVAATSLDGSRREAVETIDSAICFTDTPGPNAWVSAAAELRQVTVLVATLVESGVTPLELEPEAEHDRIHQYLGLALAVVQRYGGVIVQRLKNTLVAVLGLPGARSDDAERALCAVRDLHRDLATAVTQPLYARIGLANGLVVASATRDAGSAYAITGTALDMAIDLAAKAAPGDTLLAESLHQSCAGRPVATAFMETTILDLKQRPAWRFVPSRSADSRGTPLRFVGRQAELRVFQGIVEIAAESTSGHSFLVRGEAGIGKTRLVEEFALCAEAHGFRCHRGVVLAFGAGHSDDAIQSLLRSLLDAVFARSRERIAEQAVQLGLIETHQQVFLNDLLNAPQPPELRALYDAMDRAIRRQGRLETLRRLVTKISEGAPLLLTVEDIHWADPQMLGYLAEFAAAVAQCAVVLVMTTRVEGEPLDPQWRGAMHGAPLTTIDLGPLHERDAFALAAQLAARDSDLVRQCVRRSGGHPLFLEQLLRAGGSLDADDGAARIPDAVRSIVWGRLDALAPPDKRAVQAASIMGQRFSLAALRELIDAPSYACEPLIAQRLVRPQGEDYLFTHALIADAVYASMLPSQLRHLHWRAARWFAKRDPVLHAEHLQRAEDPEAPVAFLTAARQGMREYRFETALDLASRGLRLARHAETRFDLACMRGEILREVGAIGDSLAAFENALLLLDDESKRYRARIGIAAALRIQDRFAEALDVLSAAERAAARSADAEALAEIDALRGGVLFSLGRAEECLDAHTQALRYAREAGSPVHEARAQSGLGDAYYQRGQMSTAYRHYGQCITLCREHGYGRIEVANLAMQGWTRFYQNELADTCEDLAHAAEIAERVADQRAEALARFLLATAQSYAADWMSGQMQAERSLALARRLGAKRLEAAILRAQADLLIGAGQAAEAETTLNGAYALSVQTGTETFVGPWILAVLARATTDAAKRRWALAEGKTVLARSNVAHSHLHYYQNAIEVALDDQDWDAAERYTSALECYTQPEPLPWSAFVIMRGRALARLGSGQTDAVTLATLKDLRSQAERGGLNWALPRLRLALDQG